jgi:hypothetical protein
MNDKLLEYYALCAVKNGTPLMVNELPDMVASGDFSKYFRKSGKKIVPNNTIIVGGGDEKVRVY